jgi:hypothetical protein
MEAKRRSPSPSFIYVYLCRVYLGAPIYLCFIYVYLCSIYVYLCSTRAPSSFIHILCIFIYVRTYEPCLVRFYHVFIYIMLFMQKEIFMHDQYATKRKAKEISHMH